MASSTVQCWIIDLFWRFHFRKNSIFQNILGGSQFSFTKFLFLHKIILLKISTFLKIISVKAAKAFQYHILLRWGRRKSFELWRTFWEMGLHLEELTRRKPKVQKKHKIIFKRKKVSTQESNHELFMWQTTKEQLEVFFSINGEGYILNWVTKISMLSNASNKGPTFPSHKIGEAKY
jgi:hypothetical protein